MSTKVKAKIIQNIEFDGDYNTISIIKNNKEQCIDFYGETRDDYYFSLSNTELDEFISALQLVKQQISK